MTALYVTRHHKKSDDDHDHDDVIFSLYVVSIGTRGADHQGQNDCC